MRIKSGSCLCGEVTFEIEGDFDNFYLCHCSRCRKDTGSAHGANLFSSTAKLKWLSGVDKVTNFKLPSTQHNKSFCSICGSALPNIQLGGELLVVPAGSLDCDRCRCQPFDQGRYQTNLHPQCRKADLRRALYSNGPGSRPLGWPALSLA